MNTYTTKTHTVKGKPVSVIAPVVGYHQKTGAAVLDIPQIDDKQWEELAKKNMDNRQPELESE